MDASEYKDFIFALLFLKRLSDQFDEERERVISHYLKSGKSQTDAEKQADDEDEYTFYVPERAREKGVKFGRPRRITENTKQAIRLLMREPGLGMRKIASTLGCGVSTCYAAMG